MVKVTTAVAAAALITASASAAAVPPSDAIVLPKSGFTIFTKLRCGGPSEFEGQAVYNTHIGAGESALVTATSMGSGIAFNLTTGGYLESNIGKSVYRVYLSTSVPAAPPPANSTVPPDYYEITWGVEAGTPNFTIDEAGYINSLMEGFKTFALCKVNGVAPYFGNGNTTENQLLWTNSFHEATEDSQCADVLLKPIPVNP